jgi:hypothetical protein
MSEITLTEGSAPSSPDTGKLKLFGKTDGKIYSKDDAGLELVMNPNVSIVAYDYAEFTGTQTNATAAGANFAITDLSISHALANSANRLLLLGQCGVLADSTLRGQGGLLFDAGGTLIGAGDSASSRSRVGAGGYTNESGVTDQYLSQTVSIMMVYEPSSTSSVTYTLKVINLSSSTRTMYVNRTVGDADGVYSARGASYLILIELEG